jgi:hypothetical protein
MAYNTPWCPRCGDWRGYIEKMCKGCKAIEAKIVEVTPGKTAEEITTLRRLLVADRFALVSERRTQREAYTQQLEDFVDKYVNDLKSLSYRWGKLRQEAKATRFDYTYAKEVSEALGLALGELENSTKELTKFHDNPQVHIEMMERINVWRDTLTKFKMPDAMVEAQQQADEPEEDEE